MCVEWFKIYKVKFSTVADNDCPNSLDDQEFYNILVKGKRIGWTFELMMDP